MENYDHEMIIENLKALYGEEKFEERTKLFPEYSEKLREIGDFVGSIGGNIYNETFPIDFLNDHFEICNYYLHRTYYDIIQILLRDEERLMKNYQPYSEIDALYLIIKNEDILNMDSTDILKKFGDKCGLYGISHEESELQYKNICDMLKLIEDFLTKESIVKKYNNNFVFAQFLDKIIFNMKEKISRLQEAGYADQKLDTISSITTLIRDSSQANKSDIEILNQLAGILWVRKYCQDDNIKKRLDQLLNYKKYWEIKEEEKYKLKFLKSK